MPGVIPLFKARIPSGAEAAVADVLRSGYVAGGGEVVTRFERALAGWLGCDPACLVTTNSGTSALLLAYTLAGVRDGLVVTTPMTFVATTTAIYQAGSEPAWADVDRATCQIDAADVERVADTINVPRRLRAGQPPPKAIIAVAWGGFLPDLDALKAVASRHRVPMILDAAQALGATWRGRPAHEQANFTIYSFAPTKHLNTGDGGALVCRRAEDATRARRLAWFGMDRHPEGCRWPSDQDIPEAGFKLHMNSIAAAMGLAGLDGLDGALAACRRNAAIYHSVLGGQQRMDGASPWTWTVFVDDPAAFIVYMADGGVTAGQPHRRNDANKFAVGSRRWPLPNTDFVQAHYCCIPVGWWVSEDNARRIAAQVNAYTGLTRGLP